MFISYALEVYGQSDSLIYNKPDTKPIFTFSMTSGQPFIFTELNMDKFILY